MHLAGRGVDGEVAEHPQPRLVRLWGGVSATAGAAKQRPDPRDQLPWGERLGDVVICAHAETDQDVDLVGAGGEHQHVAAGERPQLAADLDPIDAGQAEVEHHHVRFGLAGQGERGLAVDGGAHREPVPGQESLHDPDEARFVIDDQSAQLLRRGHSVVLLRDEGPVPGVIPDCTGERVHRHHAHGVAAGFGVDRVVAGERLDVGDRGLAGLIRPQPAIGDPPRLVSGDGRVIESL